MAARIGLMDSGVGGLTVLRRVDRMANPNQAFLYWGTRRGCPWSSDQARNRA